MVVALGKVDGEISVSGLPGKWFLKGRLISFSHDEQEGDFQQARINFSGNYPVIEISDSTVSQPDGMLLRVKGKLDLRDSKNFENQIKALQKEPLIEEKTGRVEWTLKRRESQNHSGATEVKYMMRKKDNADATSRDSEGMLGVEHQIQF